jgi:uncharacterized protein YaiI (UPF0178 family)
MEENGHVKPVLIVDAANVVGSVPDGWWRDRAGAARRLRDALAEVAERGLPQLAGPVEVILVVEGAARDVSSSPTVRVAVAPGSGDDAIVDLVRERCDEAVVVVTSDRGLRERVLALGATTVGPRSLPYEGKR